MKIVSEEVFLRGYDYLRFKGFYFERVEDWRKVWCIEPADDIWSYPNQNKWN